MRKLFISIHGDDTHPGTEKKPLRTTAGAMRLIEKMSKIWRGTVSMTFAEADEPKDVARLYGDPAGAITKAAAHNRMKENVAKVRNGTKRGGRSRRWSS